MLALTSKLAVSNLFKNKQLYIPFALATMMTTSLLYIFNAIRHNPLLDQAYGGNSIKLALSLGEWIVLIVACIIPLYANSFVMKQRSKELGLYGILGLERRHMQMMILTELVLFMTLTVGSGMLLGVLLDKLMFALLLQAMQFPVVLTDYFAMSNVFDVLCRMGVIFLVLFAINALRTSYFNPLALLKEKKRGEKQARFLFVPTLIGLALLGCGYYLAQSVESPIKAMTVFTIAVILVILGTYILFYSGSIYLLKFLQKRNSYYQAKNFIAISNLIFRMRKNAAGLATICILSTMVLVTLVTSAGLFVGTADYVQSRYPHDYTITRSVSKPEDIVAFQEQNARALDSFAKAQHVTIDKTYTYVTTVLAGMRDGQQFTSVEDKITGVDTFPSATVHILDVAGYAVLTGENLTLQGKEIAVFDAKNGFKENDTLQLNGQALTVKRVIAQPKNQYMGSMYLGDDDITIVVNQLTDSLSKELIAQGPNNYFTRTFTYQGVMVKDLSRKQQIEKNAALFETMRALDEYGAIEVQSRAEVQEVFGSMIGTLFFVGVLLGSVFLLSAVLVIYYKQVAEGYEDRQNFVTLHKVGLSKKEIQQTIRKQVLVVFFTPAISAIIHLAVAYKMVSLILNIFGITNSQLMLVTTSSVVAVFILVYMIVFWLTSKSYARIVRYQ